MPQNLDLSSIFSSVTEVLSENKTSLNKADTYNGDHGTNMVSIFKTITDAVSEKSGADPSDQLEYASKLLGQQKSGSAKVYTKGLESAAQQFLGKQVTPDNAMELIQLMLGGGQELPAENPVQGLLGNLFGGETDDDKGLDAGDLISAGMAFFSAKNRGVSNREALVEAVISASPMSESPHRTQSSQLVVNSILQAIGGMGKK